MYFAANAEGTKNESFISSFEKDILKIFRNKDVSSEDRIGEYKKIVHKYEYNHYKYENKNDKISKSTEAKDDDGTSDDDFQLHDPNRVDQTDDGATYSNDKKLNTFGSLDNKTNVINDFKFLNRQNNVKLEKKKRKKNNKENVNISDNKFKKKPLQSAITLTDPIEQIHLNNVIKEKFENNDNLTFLKDKNSQMSIESMPYMVSGNTEAVVNPNFIPNRSPISMFYDFDEDNKNVDKGKPFLDFLNRETPTEVKKKYNRKPTGIGKLIAKKHDNNTKKRMHAKTAKKHNNKGENRFPSKNPKIFQSKEKSKRKIGSDLDDDEIELETRRQIEMNLLNKYSDDNQVEQEIESNREIDFNSIIDNNNNQNNKNNELSNINSFLIHKLKKNQKPLKRLQSKYFLHNQQKDRNKKLKDKKSNKRKKYQLEQDSPNKKFKPTNLKLFNDDINDDSTSLLTDEDTSSTIVNLLIIFYLRLIVSFFKVEVKKDDFTDYRHKKFGYKSENRKFEDDLNDFSDYKHKKFGNRSERKKEIDALIDLSNYRHKKFDIISGDRLLKKDLNDIGEYNHKKFGKRSERNNVKEEGKITDLYDYRHKKFGNKSEKRTVEDDINNFDDYRHKKFGNKSEKRTVEDDINNFDDYRHKKFGNKSEKKTVEDDASHIDDYRHKKFAWTTYHFDNIN
jgi:hypothetical protein